MREMEAERQIQALRLRASDSASGHYTAKVPADHPHYKPRVAEPTMAAIDALPAEWRQMIYSAGYVDVYRAFRRNWPLARVREQAERHGGLFVL
jgi:hypothetical protein